ncbi:glycosyltransferase 61 family protein [uncultured Thomasclavelia sp.]|uniref:glycosyltransferase family 61 protein n=1 Tax=uncultured Thomasclavelia sp. TaxID=3025759 RepID=UPI00262BC689|nr:glycosyltransferase 61 family protein [uncultured Thomasclavelia sp.]
MDKIDKMYKRKKKPIVKEYDCAYILPRKFVKNGPGWGSGGVVDKNKNFIDLSAYHGGWIDQGGYYDFNEYSFVNETVVYMGLFFKHWGHFLVDLLPRLWYLAQYSSSNENIKVAYIGEETIDGNYLELFELIGINKSQLIRISTPMQFSKIIIPEFSCRPCIWYTDEYVFMFNKIIKNALKIVSVPDYLKNLDKVYFSRTTLKKAKLTEFGERLIENIYRDNDYLIVSPEKLNLKEQIYIWNNASEIVCLNGTIPINVVFSMNQNLQLIILNKTSLCHLNLYLFLLMRQVKYEYVNVYIELFKNIPKSIGSGPFLLSVTKEFRNYLKKNQLINNYSLLYIYRHNIINGIKYCHSIVNINKMKYWLYKKIITPK